MTITPWRRLTRRVSRRGACLLFYGMLGLSFAISLMHPAPNLTNLYAALFLPLWAWALLWLVTGLVCLVYAFIPHRDRIAFTVMSGAIALWSLIALAGAVTGYNPRGWFGAIVFLAFGAKIYIIGGWPDQPRDGSRTRPDQVRRGPWESNL